MSEVTLTAETGRPTGTPASRRARLENKASCVGLQLLDAPA